MSYVCRCEVSGMIEPHKEYDVYYNKLSEDLWVKSVNGTTIWTVFNNCTITALFNPCDKFWFYIGDL